MVGGSGRRPAAAVAVLVVVVAAVAGGLVLASRPDPGPPPVAGPERSEPVPAGDPAEVAHAFLAAWQAGDWDRLQDLTADDSLDVGGTHRQAHQILGVASTRIRPGEPRPDGDVVRVPFEVTWELEGLGEHTFTTELSVVESAGAWTVRWWYPTLHPDMAPGRRFERVRVFPERAPILGADGQPLVTSEQRARILVEPRRVTAGHEPILEALADVAGADLDAVRALLARDDLEPDGRYPVAELGEAEFADVRHRLGPVPGLVFDTRTVRVPATEGVPRGIVGTTGEITAELLEELGDPYRQADVVGRSGLERVHERRLAGRPEQEARIMEGETLVTTLVYVEGSDPETLTVTVDPGVQAAAEAALTPLQRPAALVAIDARTGEVRAAASHPPDEFDRALAGRYPPGSTFKIVGATALLTEGLRGGDEVPCPPQVRVGGRDFGNAGGYGPGDISFVEAFARSCNTAFILLTTELGADRADEAAAQFGFDTDYETGLPAFGGSFPEPVDDTELASAAIGQARVEASPLHMASVAAAASSGTWRSPHLVREGIDVLERALPPEATQPLRAMMRAVVSSGTGTAARLEGDPPVAGKTGSAQFGDGSATHAWFVGFRGDLAFAVVIEGGGGGGGVAAPVAAAFLRALP
jgi:cell division protein FtsI/penicillin-binding protein 2